MLRKGEASRDDRRDHECADRCEPRGFAHRGDPACEAASGGVAPVAFSQPLQHRRHGGEDGEEALDRLELKPAEDREIEIQHTRREEQCGKIRAWCPKLRAAVPPRASDNCQRHQAAQQHVARPVGPERCQARSSATPPSETCCRPARDRSGRPHRSAGPCRWTSSGRCRTAGPCNTDDRRPR